MLDRFKQYLATQHLVPDGSKVLLAVSGGRDSVAMAHLFHSAGLAFDIAHCNFNLRPGDCDRDQDFVRQLAQRYGVEFHTVSFDTLQHANLLSQSIEEAARELRYAYFIQLCHDCGYRYVATAHHSDDSIETFFLNLFRGTGIAGLHGILPLSERGSMTLIRPMLCFSRRDIDTYIEQHRLQYVEDSTNSQLDARRNQIRLRLMPLLHDLYPSVEATMLSNMEHLREVEEVYDSSVERLTKKLLHFDNSPFGFSYDYFNIPDLLALEPRRPLVYALLRRYRFSSSTVDNIIAALEHSQTGTRFSGPFFMAAVDRNRLIIVDHFFRPPQPEVDIEVLPAQQLDVSACRSGESNVEYIDADRVHLPLTVRLWQPGDRFYPFGMAHQRRVSDFLKDCKVNIFEKSCIHVLTDADQRIVWIVGLRLDNRFRISDSTRRILRIALSPTPWPV